MKKKFLYTIFILLLVAAVSLILFNRFNKSSTNINRAGNDNATIGLLANTIIMYGEALDVHFDKKFIVLDSNGKEHELKTIINKQMIVYKINEKNCMKCVEKYLPNLLDIAKKVGKDNVLILGSFTDPKNLFLTLQKYNTHQLAIFNLAPSYVKGEKIEIVNMPYIFQIDSAFTVKNVFIPQKEIPMLSEYYSRSIRN